MKCIRKAVLIYILIIVLMFSPIIAIPFMSSEYMQVGWVFLFYTIPAGILALLVYTIYLLVKK